MASVCARLATRGELGGDRKLEDVVALVLADESIERSANAPPGFFGLPLDERQRF